MIRPPSHRAGFTLIEMLVVIGIIAVLASVIGVVVSKARGTANKFQLSAQLHTIEVALDAYKTDFQAFPTTTIDVGAAGNVEVNADGFRGARTLCKALMGQCGGQSGAIGAVGSTYDPARANQDGKSGFGFTVIGRSGVATIADTTGNMTGKSYGPYLSPDKFKCVNIATIDGTVVNTKTYNHGDQLPSGGVLDDRAVLLDANDSPILYWPCLNPQAPVSWSGVGTKTAGYAHVGLGYTTTVLATPSPETDASGATVSYTRYGTPTGTPMYDARDNAAWITGPAFRKLLGDTNADGEIDLSLNEKPAVVGKYILWSSGPDKLFGPDPKGITDDVTNYQGE